jgi:hypothetical protein
MRQHASSLETTSSSWKFQHPSQPQCCQQCCQLRCSVLSTAQRAYTAWLGCQCGPEGSSWLTAAQQLDQLEGRTDEKPVQAKAINISAWAQRPKLRYNQLTHQRLSPHHAKGRTATAQHSTACRQMASVFCNLSTTAGMQTTAGGAPAAVHNQLLGHLLIILAQEA